MTISELTLTSSVNDPVRREKLFTGAGRRRDWTAEHRARIVAKFRAGCDGECHRAAKV